MSRSRRKLPRSPLQLDSFWLQSLRVEANENWDGDPDGAPPTVPLTGRTDVADIGDGRFVVHLNVGTKGARRPVPYSLDVTAGGVFAVPPNMPEEEIHRFIHLNGSAVLYGIVRGAVASVTGMGPLGVLTLPSVNFVHFFDSVVHQHEGEEASGSHMIGPGGAALEEDLLEEDLPEPKVSQTSDQSE